MEQIDYKVRGESGFSLIELVIAIGVVLVLTVSGIIGYGAVTDNARKAATQSAAKDVLTAAMVYDSDLPSNNTEVEDAAIEWNKSRGKGNELVTTESGLQTVDGDRCVVAKATHAKGYVSVRAGGDTKCDALNEDTKNGEPIGGGDGSENGSNPGGSENGTGEEFLDVNGDGFDDNTGLDKDGYDKDGYDKDGYNRDGVDRDGKDRDGNHVITSPGGNDWYKNKGDELDWTQSFGPGGPKTVTFKLGVHEFISDELIDHVANEDLFGGGDCATDFDSCSASVKILDRTNNVTLCSINIDGSKIKANGGFNVNACNRTVTGHYPNGATDEEIGKFLPEPPQMHMVVRILAQTGNVTVTRATIEGGIDYTVFDTSCSTSSVWDSYDGNYKDREIIHEDTGFCDNGSRYERFFDSLYWFGQDALYE